MMRGKEKNQKRKIDEEGKNVREKVKRIMKKRNRNEARKKKGK